MKIIDNYMSFRQWLENTSPLQASSKEEMLERYKKMSAAERQAVLDWAEEINKQGYARRLGTTNPILLFHGSPHKIEQFKLMPGKRSLGFMGAGYDVQNQGVFLSDSKPMAAFYGSNRAENPHQYTVYSVYVNADRVMDLTSVRKLPQALRKLGLDLLAAWEGRKTNLTNADIWWLLDKPEFIAQIKQLGFTGVKFREDKDVHKDIKKGWHYKGGANTYLIFDPSQIIIKDGRNDLIHDFDTLWKYSKV
jgi:hypothetical protein